MKSLGDLLELIHTSMRRIESIRATIELTVDLESAERAERIAERLSSETKYGRLGRHDSQAGEFACTFHLWLSTHVDAWRLETRGMNGPIVSRSEGANVKSSRWWPVRWRIRPGPMDPLVRLHVDPSPFLSMTWLEVRGDVTYLNREAVLIAAVPRPNRDFLAMAVPYAQRYEMVVDQDVGVLLAVDAFLDDTAFIRSRMTSVQFNEDLPATLFTED